MRRIISTIVCLLTFMSVHAQTASQKDFLTIREAMDIVSYRRYHPLTDGDMDVLIESLMKKYGYEIGDYFAIPNIMKHRVGAYIDAFEASSKGWSDNANDYTPYVTFILKCILEAYRKLDYIMEINMEDETSEEKVLRIVNDSATPINKEVVQNVLYATSPATIEKALSSLVKNQRIQLITKGRYSKYFRL